MNDSELMLCTLGLSLTVLAWAQARLLITVGRELERRGAARAGAAGVRLAWMCPVYLVWAPIGYLPSDIAMILLPIFGGATVGFWILCSILWRSTQPARILLGAFGLALAVAIVLWLTVAPQLGGSHHRTPWKWWQIGVIDALGVIVLVAPLGVWHFVSSRGLLRWAKGPSTPPPTCTHCGYSLVGLTPQTICPECGKPETDGSSSTPPP